MTSTMPPGSYGGSALFQATFDETYIFPDSAGVKVTVCSKRLNAKT